MKYIYESKKGYDNHIGILVSQMDYTRYDTKQLVASLSTDNLDYNVDNYSNSIGTLLSHFSALEFYFQRLLFFNRKLTEAEKKKYYHAMPGTMNTRKIYGNDLNYYLQELDATRNITLEKLKNYDDKWLFSFNGISTDMNNFFIIRHFIDDEIGHQGQIKWIKKRMSL